MQQKDFLGMDTESTENLITDIVYGQMRLIIAEMTIEKLNSDRDEFLDKARKTLITNLINWVFIF